jgi:ATP-dependent DNA ligase
MRADITYSASAPNPLDLTVAYPRAKPPSVGAKAPHPGFVEPALASSIAKVPAGDRWIHEVKFDGYRVQVHLASEEVKGIHPARQRLDRPL